uniref:Uncharacterized protein n=1 Tax=Rhizophora mucronata TaxID=61149 RepID=A0A2P2MZI3_RHIMU
MDQDYNVSYNRHVKRDFPPNINKL